MIYRTYFNGKWWQIDRRHRWWPFWSYFTLELDEAHAVALIQRLKEPPVIL